IDRSGNVESCPIDADRVGLRDVVEIEHHVGGITRPAKHEFVAAGAAEEEIVAVTAEETVAAGVAEEAIVARVARHRVPVSRTDQVLDAVQLIPAGAADGEAAVEVDPLPAFD